MTDEKNKYQEQTLFQITWPLFIEISLHMTVGILATLILSGYSDNAVAGVGVANQLLNIFILVFNVTAIGATILIGQSLGAKTFDRARRLSRSSIGINLWVGLIITALVFIFSKPLIGLYGVTGEVHDYALAFFQIVGLSLFLEAMALALSAILRSHGHTRQTMYVTIMMNIISVIGNFIAVKGFFGLIPITGVTGVAWSIFIARIFVVIALFYLVYKMLSLKVKVKDFIKINKTDVKDLLAIGVPSAGENFSYNFSAIVITSFVAMMGDASLAARVYILNISYIVFLFSMAAGQGTQILVSRYIGAREFDLALKRGLKTLQMCMSVALATSLLIAFVGEDLLYMFTTDPAIIAVSIPVLWAIVFIEPGRAMNIILMGTLKSVGDVRFPVVIGVISMWSVAVLFSYILGIHFGLGLLGVWLAQGLDEWIRGLFAFRRWVSKAWQRKYQKKELNVELGS